jgi:hypothetical protein
MLSAASKRPSSSQTRVKPADPLVVVYPAKHTGMQLSPVTVDDVHEL